MRQAGVLAICLGLSLWVLAPCAIADPGEETSLAERDPDYAAGKTAMDKKDWGGAVRYFVKTAAREPDNADLHNHLGYSYRNLKQMDLAIKHYKRAIELDPRHRGAHEYIGEAYLMMNDLPGAEKHLRELRRICLLSCEELADLEKAVAGYRARRQ
jgi:Flp pilus assembly protein TadD